MGSVKFFAWSSYHLRHKYQRIFYLVVAAPRKERAYEKYAWILLLVTPVIFLFQSLRAVLGSGNLDSAALFNTGMTLAQLEVRSPYVGSWIGDFSRSFGVIGLGFSIFAIAIIMKSYRRGEKWAWFVSWYQPASWVGLAASLYILGIRTGKIETAPFLVYAIFATIAVFGTVLPYRKFFPKK